jgi:methionine-rich copper-binding protein CopC
MDTSLTLLRSLGLALALAVAGATHAVAHAMPEHSSPPVGATVASAPQVIRILFDADLEGALCELRVEDAQKHVVSAGPARVDPQNDRLLEVAMKPVGPGTYRVFWVAVSRDTHRTEGSYTFTVSR